MSLVSRLLFGYHPMRNPFFYRLIMDVVTLLRPTTLTCKNGIRLFIPKTDRSPHIVNFWLQGEYEPEEMHLLDSLLHPGDTVIDVGANIGYVTCNAARLVGPEGHVHAFEPDPDNFTVLTRNIELNGFSNCHPQQAAVSDTTASSSFYLSSVNRGDHTLIPIDGREVVSVKTVSLDDLFLGTEKPIRVVKIDVQGFELQVLRGMKRLIAERRVDHIIVEFWPWRMAQGGQDPMEFIRFVEGYSDLVRSVVSSTDEIAPRSFQELTESLADYARQSHVFFTLLLSSSSASNS